MKSLEVKRFADLYERHLKWPYSNAWVLNLL